MMRQNKFNTEDTIAAIAAPIGGPICIIRMSGKDSTAILKKVFVRKINNDFKSHKIYYGWIADGKENIDEVLVSVMLAPKSFTKEDVVEINCHGGRMPARKILMLLVKFGARIAEPGEFTKRAFLNGRIDLAQAEAIMDIVNAKTELSHKTAVGQLQGRLGTMIEASCESLLSLLARIEMAIDYPEHDEAHIITADIKTAAEAIIKELDKLLDTSNQGRIIREGIKTAIIGEPNVGKSSLLNALALEDRAIVTHIPGTTRDILRENIKIGDIFLEIADTAGIRETDDIVENQGVARSVKESLSAELVLLVVDGSMPFTASQADKFDYSKWKHILVIINKSDLPQKVDKDFIAKTFGADAIIEISAKNHDGIDALHDKIKEIFLMKDIEYSPDLVTNTRHISLIEAAKNSLQDAVRAIDEAMYVDFIAIDIQAAYASLCEITGAVVDDMLIDKIFSEFCLGK